MALASQSQAKNESKNTHLVNNPINTFQEGEDHAKMEVDLFAIPDVNTEHHLLVHTKGEIGDGCANTGPIFDPEEEYVAISLKPCVHSNI